MRTKGGLIIAAIIGLIVVMWMAFQNTVKALPGATASCPYGCDALRLAAHNIAAGCAYGGCEQQRIAAHNAVYNCGKTTPVGNPPAVSGVSCSVGQCCSTYTGANTQ